MWLALELPPQTMSRRKFDQILQRWHEEHSYKTHATKSLKALSKQKRKENTRQEKDNRLRLNSCYLFEKERRIYLLVCNWVS